MNEELNIYLQGIMLGGVFGFIVGMVFQHIRWIKHLTQSKDNGEA